MLSIYFGETDDEIYHPPTYFDNVYEDDWIIDPLSKQMILDVDKSEVVSSHLIDSPVLGPISPLELSGGVKTLMLMKFDKSGKIFNATVCGDNCAKWMLVIGKEMDLTVNLHNLMEFGDEPFEIKILNTGDVVSNMYDLVYIAGDFV